MRLPRFWRVLLYSKPEGEKSMEEFVRELLLVRLNVAVIASTHTVSTRTQSHSQA